MKPKSPNVVYYAAHESHLTPDAMAAEFAKLGKNDPLWQAFMQLLQRRLAQATADAALREENAPGRIEELLGLQQEFVAMRDGPAKRAQRS